MSTKLSEYEGKNIFIIGTDFLHEEDPGQLAIYEDFSDLNEHLKMLSPISEASLLTLHGVFTSAKYIPGEVGRHVYIIIQSPDDGETGCIYETDGSDDIEMLSEYVSDIIAGNASCPYDDITIDNVFILYGYELNMGYSVHEDEIDEEILEECQGVAKQVRRMRGGKYE